MGARAYSHSITARNWKRICIALVSVCLGSSSIDESVSLTCSDVEVLRHEVLGSDHNKGNPGYDYADGQPDSAQNLAFGIFQMNFCKRAPKRQTDCHRQICPL